MKILNLGNRIVNQYLIELADGFLLVDTGYSNAYKRFIKNLSKHRIKAEQIKYVFVTHAHDDHIGFLNELLKNFPHITLIVNSLSKERFSEGHNHFIGGCTTLRAYLFCKFMRLLGKGRHEFPIVNDTLYKTIECDKLSNLRPYGINADIVFLQGHTGDQMGLLFDDGTFFCGDAAMNGFPSKHKIIIFVENLDDYKQTWDKIIGDRKIRKLFPAHGKPFNVALIKKNRRYLDKIKLRKLKNISRGINL